MKKILNNYEREEKNRLYYGYMDEYKKCQKKMQESAQLGRHYCSYGVTLVNDFFPDWDFKNAILIIMKKLREEGILVMLEKPNLLLINWGKFKINDKDVIEKKKKYWEEIENTKKFIKKLNDVQDSDEE